MTVVVSTTATTVNLSTVQVPVTVEVQGNTNPLTVVGGAVSTTFVQTGTQLADVTFEGGPTGSQNTFQVAPNNNFNDNVVSNGGSNTLDISRAFLPTDVVKKSGSTPQVIGATVNLTKVSGQTQIIYNSAVLDPDIGSLLDPSLLVSNSTASLSLKGTVQTVIAGSDSTLYAAPATSDGTTQVPGTTIILVGTGNKVFGAAGSNVLAYSGGNDVVQAADQSAVDEVNAYVAGSSTQAQNYLDSPSTAQQAFVAANAAEFAKYIVDNPGTIRPSSRRTPRPSPGTSRGTRRRSRRTSSRTSRRSPRTSPPTRPRRRRTSRRTRRRSPSTSPATRPRRRRTSAERAGGRRSTSPTTRRAAGVHHPELRRGLGLHRQQHGRAAGIRHGESRRRHGLHRRQPHRARRLRGGLPRRKRTWPRAAPASRGT